jgi:hypothetical protein
MSRVCGYCGQQLVISPEDMNGNLLYSEYCCEECYRLDVMHHVHMEQLDVMRKQFEITVAKHELN